METLNTMAKTCGDAVAALKYAMQSDNPTETTCRVSDFLLKARGSTYESYFPGMEDMIAGQSDVFDDNEQMFVHFSEFLYKFGNVGDFEGREDIGYEEKDFSGVSDRAELVMECFTVIVELYSEAIKNLSICCGQRKNMERVLGNVICVRAFFIAIEHCASQLWTSDNSMQASQILIKTIQDKYGCASVKDLLCGQQGEKPTPPFFKFVLQEVRLKITKSKWKQNPGLQHVFVQCLLSVGFPHLSDHLDLVFPPSLLITDDHLLANKVEGIHCLSHILDNCSSTEIRWQGRADVIYDTLQRFMYTHEPQLFDVLFPCLLRTLAVVEPPNTRTRRCHGKYDDTMQRLLQDMEIENRLDLRRVYAKHLPSLIQVMGIDCVKHFQRLFRVMLSYMEVYDGPFEEARLSILECLKVTMKYTWPRIPHHADNILKALLKLLFDLSFDHTVTSDQVKDNVILKVVENVNLLQEICPDYVKSCLVEIKNAKFNSKFLSSVAMISPSKKL